MKFSQVDNGEEFEHDGERYEKNQVHPGPSIRGIVENAISLEDHTGVMFEPDHEVKRVD